MIDRDIFEDKEVVLNFHILHFMILINNMKVHVRIDITNKHENKNNNHFENDKYTANKNDNDRNKRNSKKDIVLAA